MTTHRYAHYTYTLTNKISYWLAVSIVISVGYAAERALVRAAPPEIATFGVDWVPNVALIIWIGAEFYWSMLDLLRQNTGGQP